MLALISVVMPLMDRIGWWIHEHHSMQHLIGDPSLCTDNEILD